MTRSAENGLPTYEWGVQWDDCVIAYADEEIARHEQRFPVRPDRVNPVLVRREVGDWTRVTPPAMGNPS